MLSPYDKGEVFFLLRNCICVAANTIFGSLGFFDMLTPCATFTIQPSFLLPKYAIGDN